MQRRRDTRTYFVLAVMLLWLFTAFVFAEGETNDCRFPQLKNQQKDSETIQRLEMAWTEAYLRGDTTLMSCLLAPDFTEIMRSGELKTLQDELAMAKKNRGKNLKMPEPPKIRVLLHENAAVAYGVSVVKSSDGQVMTRWYSDTYLWKNGQWHAFFAQQTAAESR
jgi:hypothetical protein